eukprot:EG_transcript_26112
MIDFFQVSRSFKSTFQNSEGCLFVHFFFGSFQQLTTFFAAVQLFTYLHGKYFAPPATIFKVDDLGGGYWAPLMGGLPPAAPKKNRGPKLTPEIGFPPRSSEPCPESSTALLPFAVCSF